MRLVLLVILIVAFFGIVHADEQAQEQSAADAIISGCGEPTIENLKEFSDCVNRNCKALLKDKLDKARKEKDSQKKIDLYDKGMEIYMECISFGMSGLADAEWDGGVGRAGNPDDGLGWDAGLIWKEKCDEKIKLIQEKIAKETDPEKLAKLYEELQETLLECASFTESGLVDSGSELSESFHVIVRSLPDWDGNIADENEFDYETPEGQTDYGKIYRETYRKHCELLKKSDKQCGEKEIKARDPAGEDENGDIYTKVVPEQRAEATEEAKKIINLAPERFSENAGVYTIRPDDIASIRYIDSTPIATILNRENPSPKVIITLGFNAAEKAEKTIDETDNGNAQTQPDNSPETKNDLPETEVLDADISIIVNGEVSQKFSPDGNNQIKIKSKKPLSLPILFSLTEPTPESLVNEAKKNGETMSTDYVNYLREIVLYKDPILDELTETQKRFIGSPANCPTPNECTTNLSDKWNLVFKWRKTTLSFDVKDNAGMKKEFKAGVKDAIECTENWSCDEWSAWGACSNETQSRTRTCNDTGNCGTTNSKPPTSESQACEEEPEPCTENWNCSEWSAWSEPGSCQESGTQAKTRTRTCNDTGNCGTTNSKPNTGETTTQSCTYNPANEKAEYSSHVSDLGGSRISSLNFEGDSKAFDLTLTGGTYGYKILNIPSKATIKVCVAASTALGLNYYPQYHYGFDWGDPSPGCTEIYNKNDWANGVLVHLGDPTQVNTTGTITVTKVN